MEKYLVNVGIKKGIYAAAKGFVAFAVSAKAVSLEKRFGITIDPVTFQASVCAGMFSLQHMIHDWAKMRWPNIGWL